MLHPETRKSGNWTGKEGFGNFGSKILNSILANSFVLRASVKLNKVPRLLIFPVMIFINGDRSHDNNIVVCYCA